MKKTDIVITGVGGQGVLLISKILGDAAIDSDINVVTSEIHGMAQRGGVVTSIVRFGDVYGPMIYDCDADIILSLEPVEALRVADKMSPKTTIIMNTSQVIPFTVSVGSEKYPKMEEIMTQLKKFTSQIITLDAKKVAESIGVPMALNVVMLGALAGAELLPIKKTKILDAMKRNISSKYVNENINAFELGYGITGKR
ncbi:MAG: indolepyruvate ferredoxin oxidoreductase subunit beta [Thermoplasmata archaeon]